MFVIVGFSYKPKLKFASPNVYENILSVSVAFAGPSANVVRAPLSRILQKIARARRMSVTFVGAQKGGQYDLSPIRKRRARARALAGDE